MTIWLDRLTGRSQKDPPGDDVPGRWALRQSAIQTEMNSQTLAGTTPIFLVPDRRDNWTVAEVGSPTQAKGRFGAGLLPDMTDIHALRQIAVPISQSETLGELVLVAPLPADLNDRVQRQRIDQEIERQLPHLMHVCHRPRQQLTTDLEKLPVGRAKRIPPRSIEYLTAHSEDWKRRTATGIEPTHVIAEIIEDQIDIYENRVAAELVDCIVKYLGERTAELEKIFALLNDDHNFRLALQVGKHFRLAHRISALWGSTFLDEGLSKVAAETRERLGQMRRSTLGLKGTRLYKGVPGRREVKRELHHTNILENDPHYREVAALWRAWHEYGAVQEESEGEIFTHWQQANSDFVALCRLLVIRAAHDIGWKPQDLNASASAVNVALIGPTGNPATLAVDDSGILTLTDEYSSKLRIVPLLASLARTTDSTRIADWLDEWEQTTDGTDVLILFLGKSSELDELGVEKSSLASKLEALTPIATSQTSNRWFVPVSPFEITSIEKVGRILNSWLRGQLLSSYPPKMRCPENLAAFLQLDQFGKSNSGDEWLITVPVFQQHLDAFEGKTNTLLRPDVQRQVGHVSNNAISRALLDIQNLVKFYIGILYCPVCKQRNSEFMARGGGAYSCTCRSCDSEWGLRVCGSCHSSYPYLLPDRSTDQRSGASSHGWLDRLFGEDCISVPCARPMAPGGFVCPACSKCSSEVVAGECDGCPSAWAKRLPVSVQIG
jgi:hypothetical protein